jgi:hypothetical protein
MFLQPRPPSPPWKSHHAGIWSYLEIPADVLNHFWIQVEVSELKRQSCNRFRFKAKRLKIYMNKVIACYGHPPTVKISHSGVVVLWRPWPLVKANKFYFGVGTFKLVLSLFISQFPSSDPTPGADGFCIYWPIVVSCPCILPRSWSYCTVPVQCTYSYPFRDPWSWCPLLLPFTPAFEHT